MAQKHFDGKEYDIVVDATGIQFNDYNTSFCLSSKEQMETKNQDSNWLTRVYLENGC